MAGDPQIVSSNNRGLRGRGPEVPDALEGEQGEFSRMRADEFVYFSLLFIHEANLAELLKTAHRSRIVAGVLVARPQTG